MFCRKFDSCRILKILSNSQNPIEFSKILSNILYPIEYSYGSSEDSTIYLTVSIAYSIYSTSQQPNTGFYEMRKCFSVEILFHPGHHRIWLKPIYFLTLQDISFTISILAFRPLGRFGSNYSCYRVLLYMINIVCLAVH